MNKKTPNTNDTKAKVFGAKAPQITPDDASRLIGSIIEKGIIENPQNNPVAPTPPPKPTVLPFPVARHRSHGPHWRPARSKNVGNDNNEDDEDNDSTDFDPLSAFANPVQRKQKRGLDLSHWRDIVPSDNLLVTNKMEENKRQLKKTGNQNQEGEAVDNQDNKKNISGYISPERKSPMELDLEKDSKSSMPPKKIGESMSSDMDIKSLTSSADVEIYNSRQLHVQENIGDASSSLFKTEDGSLERLPINDVAKVPVEKMEKMDPLLAEMLSNRSQKNSTVASSTSVKKIGIQQESMSLESEIDAENCARLKNMSTEEIVEAQAEIMEKMNPALINLLKKRGQEKMKLQNPSKSEAAINGELGTILHEDQTTKCSNISSSVKSDISDEAKLITSTDKMSRSNSGLVQDLGLGDASLWNSWSERVEAVRRIRFSLEGNVITAESQTGDISVHNSSVSVTERDFLRTEGDPAAVGYTIKEAVQLTRSVIPGQRALALHLLASVLDKAINNIQQNQVGCTIQNGNQVNKNDWEAIWAYALGPEPELVLPLRMCLDDNHSSVILACARVIHSALSCDLNENFFDISEKIAVYGKGIFIGPVFRSKPEANNGFLHGGFWKYNAKTSNILTSSMDVIDDENEGEHTIQDDLVVASQDFAAGLVRMGILPRMRYLLEAENNATLEEYIISILTAIARHSPTCANAIVKCQGLVDTVVNKFAVGDNAEIHPFKIKSVNLLKVLAQSDRNSCLEFINNGSFQAMIQHLFHYTSSVDHWVKSGKERCKLLSALMVEQLRFWRVCICYGFCTSYFSDIFPALCLWLNPPTFNKLLENSVLSEFFSVSREAFLVLEALARRLPILSSQKCPSNQISDCTGEDGETWSWSFVTPMVDLALKWIASRNDPYVSKYFEREKGFRDDFGYPDLSDGSLLWVFSAVMGMLSTLLERVKPEKTTSFPRSGNQVPWLPEFVPKIGLEIIKNYFLSANRTEEQKDGTFVEKLCHLRQCNKFESSFASVSFLHGLLRSITSIDNLINMAKSGIHGHPSKEYNFTREGKILEDGILKNSMVEWRCALDVFVKLVGSEWHAVQSIEVFGRGGPAPGVGLGWGASCGGFWSLTVLLAQTDARLLIYMLEIIHIASVTESPRDEEVAFAMLRVNSILGACLTFGPRDRVVAENALNILLQVPVLEYLDFCVQRFLQSNNSMKSFSWDYGKEDYLQLHEILTSHFKNRWLSVKKKLKAVDEYGSLGNKGLKKGRASLDTIHEDVDTSNMMSEDHNCTSLTVEWAHQRLPLPMHWFLSPLTVISDNEHAGVQSASDRTNLIQKSSAIVEVGKGGLFFLLAMEAMSAFLSSDVQSPICYVPLVWKLHSLSYILLVGMDVLYDSKSRNFYEALQNIYGHILDEARFTKGSVQILDGNVNLVPEIGNRSELNVLRFQSVIHENYSTFLETLVEQFSAVSYGDLTCGRQVAVYLHRYTESDVRLSAWNLLSNARVLDILPPLENCIAKAEGYLEPIEDNEGILEAYVKSWVSGALDRSAVRGSMAYTLVLHHLSSFIFLVGCDGMVSLRNKLVKSLLRDYSEKQKHEGMMVDLLKYGNKACAEKRFEIMVEACDRNSVLIAQVQKLRSAFVKKLTEK